MRTQITPDQFWPYWRMLPASERTPAFVEFVDELAREIASAGMTLRQAGTALLPAWEVGAGGRSGDFEVVAGLAAELDTWCFETEDGATSAWRQILSILEKYRRS